MVSCTSLDLHLLRNLAEGIVEEDDECISRNIVCYHLSRKLVSPLGSWMARFKQNIGEGWM